MCVLVALTPSDKWILVWSIVFIIWFKKAVLAKHQHCLQVPAALGVTLGSKQGDDPLKGATLQKQEDREESLFFLKLRCKNFKGEIQFFQAILTNGLIWMKTDYHTHAHTVVWWEVIKQEKGGVCASVLVCVSVCVRLVLCVIGTNGLCLSVALISEEGSQWAISTRVCVCLCELSRPEGLSSH